MADVKWSTWSDDGTPTTGDLLVGLRSGVNVKFDPPTMTSLAGAPLVLGGSLTTTGAYAVDLTFTGITGVTFPTTGTLATTAQLPSTGTPLSLNEGGTAASLTATDNATFVTNGTGIVSFSQTLPTAVQANITELGAQSQALNMNSHLIDNVTDPVNPQDAATKNYVDQTALNGTSVYAATTGALTVTQSGAGVGATLTNAGAQATFALDSVNPPVGVNVLVKNQAAPQNDGIYIVTNVGSGSTNWVLTRSTQYDTPVEINNTGLIIVQNGTTLTGTAWYNTATIVTVDTTAFSYSEFGNIVFPISLAHGGTNANLTASNGGIVYSGASSLGILAATATAGLALLSGASTTPTWSTLPPITRVNTQTITATGAYTYIPTAGTQYAIFEMQAAGGGSGGTTGSSGTSAAGGAGGGGNYMKLLVTAANIGASITGNIGAGGTAGASGANAGGTGGNTTAVINTSTWTAGGGVGGTGQAASAAPANSAASGAGGTATTGSNATLIANIPGQAGGVGNSTGNGAVILMYQGAPGGNAHLGFGGASPIGSTTGVGTTGNTGNNYGGGASGSANGGAGNAAGAAGAQGIVIVTEFISV